jgi:hypothetical protein
MLVRRPPSSLELAAELPDVSVKRPPLERIDPEHVDLAELFDFRPDLGVIRLHEQRVVILSTAAMGLLRKELIDTLGPETARRLMLRFGYADGYHDAVSLRDRSKWESAADGIRAGAVLHRLEGIVVYFGFLMLLFVLMERRLLIFPVVIYYVMTLGVPLINGAFHRAGFWEHFAFVMVIPLVVMLPVLIVRLVRQDYRMFQDLHVNPETSCNPVYVYRRTMRAQ